MGTGGELSTYARDWHPGSPPVPAGATQDGQPRLFLRLETSSKADQGKEVADPPRGGTVDAPLLPLAVLAFPKSAVCSCCLQQTGMWLPR